ncbi:hypothetical protein DRO53_03090 [Candidatus Bathyarchaeota archaeon]|nr:MAG: hypothetical protein DRO53_03090 [Candidatus Bathyarchaeota archaeon]
MKVSVGSFNPLGIIRALSKGYKIESEFPFFLLYFRSIATARVSRNLLFKLFAEKTVFRNISEIFKKIHVLVDVWRYGHAEACETACRHAVSKVFKTFLIRMSQSISSGEDLEDFIRREYRNFMASYPEERERMLDRLRKFCDAYTSVFSSTTLICVTILLAAIFYSFKLMIQIAVIGLTSVSMLLFLFSWIMFSQAKPDSILPKGREKPPKRRRIERITMGLLASLPAIFFLSGMELFLRVALMGIPIMVAGFLGRRYVGKVKACEQHYPSFLRQIASICSSGVPVKTALKDAVNVNYGPLNKAVRKLYARLSLRISSETAWRSFETEVDSQLISRVNGVFTDVLLRGGNINEVSKLIESVYFIYTTIRRRRYQIVSYLNGMLVPLHVAMCGMLAIISGFFTSLNKFITSMPTILPLQSALPTEFINAYFIFVLVLFSLNNASAIYSIEGDSHFTLLFLLGLMLACGSLVYGLVFQTASQYLSSILTV